MQPKHTKCLTTDCLYHQVKVHGILSHLVDNIGRVEKQNLEIICQLEHLQRQGKDTYQKEDGKTNEMRRHEKRRESRSRLDCEAHSSKKAQKEVNNQDMVGKLDKLGLDKYYKMVSEELDWQKQMQLPCT